MFESSPDLSVNTVAEIVRLALAPVFLLSGIGAFLNVLASRLSRIVDRTRDIEPMLLASRGAEHDRWIAALKVLDRRMSLINWATGLSVTSAILTCSSSSCCSQRTSSAPGWAPRSHGCSSARC